ncbi:MAG: IS21 family transposase [Bacilli bacterium]
MDKPNFSQLARELGVTRDTARKHYYRNEMETRKKKKSKIDKYTLIISQLLSGSNKKFLYISHLYDYLVDKYGEGIDFKYGAFRRYIQINFSKEFSNNASHTTGPRFETPAGAQMQFDFKESLELIDVNNQPFKVDVATTVLSHSRFVHRRHVVDKTSESTLDYFVRLFEELGGVPKQIVVDNAKSLVTTPKTSNSAAILNDRFAEFCKDFNIEVFPCVAGRPETKGKVENKIKACDKLLNYNEEYNNIGSVHDIIDKISDCDNSRISQATGIAPIMLLGKEKEQFQPLPCPEICSKYKIVTKPYTVTHDGMFSYKGNMYSLPAQLRLKKVDVRITKEKLQVYYNIKLMCVHSISDKKINYLQEHYIEATKLVFKNTIEEQAINNFKTMEKIKYG